VGVPPDPRGPRWSRHPHDRPQPYLHLLRTRHHRWWKSLLGILLVAFLALVSQVVMVIVAGVAAVLGGASFDEALEALTGTSPGALLYGNYALASLIPLTGIAVLVSHQERMEWLFSVVRRIRWRLLFGAAAFAVALMVVSVGLGVLLPASLGGGVPDAAPPRNLVLVAAVILTTTPLQAAGEEFLFRGYLAQAIASWIPPRTAALLVTAPITAGLFALAHGAQDAWLFADRFGFGIAAAVLVWLTGGLEVAIALHTVNNFTAFALALYTGTLTEAVTISEAPAGAVVLDLVALTVFTVGVWLWTRRHPVQTLSDGPVEVAARANAGPFWRPS
jgi:membrane protease YdiL (CAAX protease family)